MNETDARIREMRKGEVPLLEDFLYEAIFVPEGVEPPPRDIVRRPELRVYTDDFGTGEADLCLVAEVDGRIVGAVWSRVMEDYGHVADGVPSLAISLLPEWRGKGIGTRLLDSILVALRGRGYARVSLSVQKANRALRLYERAGFRTVSEDAEERVMVRELA